MDQQNKIDNPEIALHKYSKMIFDKGPKVFNRTRIIFSINIAEEIG